MFPKSAVHGVPPCSLFYIPYINFLVVLLWDYQSLTYVKIRNSGRSEANTNTSVLKEDRSKSPEIDLSGLVYLSKVDKLTGSGCLDPQSESRRR